MASRKWKVKGRAASAAFVFIIEAMPMLMIPNRCIWCKRQPPEVAFDTSHVLPECVGNSHQQILPPGIVCKTCNQYFGTKVEPALLEDPIFHVIAVFLRLVDPSDNNAFRDKLFDEKHPPVETPNRALDIKLKIEESELSVDVTHTVRGKLSREYSSKQLALLSRAVHKISFESLAWTTYIKGADQPVDLFADRFDHVRRWSREGQPLRRVRPVFRRPAEILKPDWMTRTWIIDGHFVSELALFGDWYGVTLTSSPAQAHEHLVKWAGNEDAEKKWCIAEKMTRVKPGM